MTDALKDLEASTINARDMVRLVQGLGLNVRIPPPKFLTIISRRKLYIPLPSTSGPSYSLAASTLRNSAVVPFQP